MSVVVDIDQVTAVRPGAHDDHAKMQGPVTFTCLN